ncbi:hypothetical protein HZB03_01510 [Candidatus Woesearchaeota archaeon]|nr:hypothetical protein [Candidatus Woesearchaeota archaeon]
MRHSKKGMEISTLGKLVLIIFILLILLIGIYKLLGPKFAVLWEKISSVLTGG